ncbi:hypothetical protein EJB05_28760 [Eragrostis curvula]|uniref:Ubiquitinyl hydrolase 1 n=1 Tax=Eragrostis curvula TaxID=38414 RepID=A0A5J9UR41_9POAL|nr:hypothetical protein EJB05_28760 [Eragrostis curvula]
MAIPRGPQPKPPPVGGHSGQSRKAAAAVQSGDSSALLLPIDAPAKSSVTKAKKRAAAPSCRKPVRADARELEEDAGLKSADASSSSGDEKAAGLYAARARSSRSSGVQDDEGGANASAPTKKPTAAAFPFCRERNPVESEDSSSSSGDEKAARAHSSSSSGVQDDDPGANASASTKKPTAAAVSFCDERNPVESEESSPPSGEEKASNKCAAPTTAASSSASSGIERLRDDDEEEVPAAASPTDEGAKCFWDSSSFLGRLLHCCGLITVVIPEKSEAPHVSEKKTCVSQAAIHYHIKESAAEKLSMYYSSFRVEHLLDRNDMSEEERLLCATEEISSAYESLNWPYDDFYEHCEAFRGLLQKVKVWKTQAGASSYKRRRLLTFFGDYQESDPIFSFLRITSATWICTHPEFSAFYTTTDDTTLEEYCRLEIIRRRSYADHLAIAGLIAALGIQLRVFSLSAEENQDIFITSCDEPNGGPIVTLVYNGIHYDILYPC